MLNYIAVGLSAFLLSEYFRDSENGGLVAQTKVMPESARLPPLDRIFEFFGFDFGERVDLFGFLPVAIALGIAYYVLLNRSLFGYELKLSGMNADAAQSAGVNPKRMVLITLFMSGAVAGMIGLPFLLADADFYKYGDAFPVTLGFTGLGIALLGRNNPVGIAAAAIVWATIERATQPPRIVRHPTGDRQDPAGLVPAGRGHRLRGRATPERRGGRRSCRGSHTRRTNAATAA